MFDTLTEACKERERITHEVTAISQAIDGKLVQITAKRVELVTLERELANLTEKKQELEGVIVTADTEICTIISSLKLKTNRLKKPV